jgi:catechol 2,3-dioxygenase-like lactoylglutathione lyase family enzyme
MRARGLVHHIDLTVRDAARSRIFYDAVLGFLGYRRAADYDHGSDWDRDGEPFHSIGIVEAAFRPDCIILPGLPKAAPTSMRCMICCAA